jgi:alpha-L-fucosidase
MIRLALAALACAIVMLTSSQGPPFKVPPPRPLLPIPTARQLEWQRREMAMFIHFGINTFTGREWGTGDENPRIFEPDKLDASQWVRVAQESGFQTVILTAKHHDGFALWPSRYSDHSIASSGWRDGEGDVVREGRPVSVTLGSARIVVR